MAIQKDFSKPKTGAVIKNAYHKVMKPCYSGAGLHAQVFIYAGKEQRQGNKDPEVILDYVIKPIRNIPIAESAQEREDLLKDEIYNHLKTLDEYKNGIDV